MSKYNNPMESVKTADKPIRADLENFLKKKTCWNNIDLNIPIVKPLNIDKIQSLDDVKRVLKFLNIEVELQEGLTRKGFEEVKDLFEY